MSQYLFRWWAMAWRLSLQNTRKNRTKSHLDRTEAKMGIQGCEHNKDAFGSEEGHPPVSFKHFLSPGKTIFVLALHPRSIGNSWKCVQQWLCSGGSGHCPSSQHTHVSEASHVGFWLIPLTVQISRKPWLDSRNFSGGRKLPGGLKPVCPTLPNFLYVVPQDEVEGSWPVLSLSSGRSLGGGSFPGTAVAQKARGLSRLYQGSQVKSLL